MPQDPRYEKGKTYALRRDGKLGLWKFTGNGPADYSKRAAWVYMGEAPPALEGNVGPIQQDTTRPESVGAFREGGATPGDLATLAGHNLTYGFSDELAGALAGARAGGHPGPMSFTDVGSGVAIPQAGASMGGREAAAAATAGRRARVAEAHENVGLLGELLAAAPAAALPVALGAGAPAAGSGLLGAMGRAGAGAALEGGLFGLGEGETAQERLIGAGVGAGIGGTVGAVAAGAPPVLLNAALRRTAGRGGRVADALRRLSGVEEGLEQATDRLERWRQGVSRHYYGPLEEAHPVVADDQVLAILRSPEVAPHTRAISREVASGARPPSLEELQAVRRRMRRVNRVDSQLTEQIDDLTEAMNAAVPGFKFADRAYAQAIGRIEALEQGRRFAGKSSADIRMAQRGLTAEEREAFRVGQLHEIVRRLEQRDEAAVSWLRRFMDAGPETRAVARTLFPEGAEGSAAYRRFAQTVATEASAEKVARLLHSGAFRLLLAGAAGAGGAAALLR